MRELLLSKLNLSTSRIRPYEGFIFLCGGPTDVRSVKPLSIRDAIHRELAKDPDIELRIRVAEDYKDWSRDAIYRDLISFETQLAELSSVIVLVLESAGSIAELGLFSGISEFNKKLLIFVDTDHYKSESFIRLGPIDYLEKVHGNLAECHHWTRSQGFRAVFDPDLATDLQLELADSVRQRASQAVPERPLNPTGWLDSALLICDLLGLCSALTVRELRQLLDGLGIVCSENDLKQTLFLLERVGLLAMEPKGDQRFYVNINTRQFVRLGVNEGPFDLMRFRADILSEYEKRDKKRFRAIQEVRRKYAM